MHVICDIHTFSLSILIFCLFFVNLSADPFQVVHLIVK